MAYSLLTHAIAGAVGATPETVTAGPIDTTGAGLLIIGVSFYEQSTRATPTDSKGNTWNPLTESVFGVFSVVERLFWCNPVSVGAGHSFTYTSIDASYATITVASFSASGVTLFDLENGATAGPGNIQPGSVTPGFPAELIVTGVGTSGIVDSIDTGVSGFAITDSNNFVTGDHFGCGLAYKIKTDQLAENPTWATGGNAAARIASFYAIAASVGGPGFGNIQVAYGPAMHPIGPVIGFGM